MEPNGSDWQSGPEIGDVLEPWQLVPDHELKVQPLFSEMPQLLPPWAMQVEPTPTSPKASGLSLRVGK